MAHEISIDEEYLERTLRDMIRINSALPNETALAMYLAEQLRSMGVKPEIEEVLSGRPNVYGRVRFGSERPFLVLSGHSDTVPPARDWETDPFEAVERDGRLYGLGAINMKAGLACMLTAFKALVESGGSSGQLGFAVTVDQEGRSRGAEALLMTDYAKCDAMLHPEHFYGDSPEDYLPIGATGKILYRLIVKGEAGHALRPAEGGINAIDAAAVIVTALGQLPLGEHDRFGRGTLCVLRIDGGYREYSMVVPERCEVIASRLMVPGETREGAIRDMRALIDRLDLEAAVTIETPPPAYEPYLLDDGEPVIRLFREVYRSVIGREPHFAGHRGIVDANIFVAAAGIPTVVFGPKGGRHHRPGEYVEMATLKPTARVLAETARRFLTPAGTSEESA